MKHKNFDYVYFWQNVMEKSKYTWRDLFQEPITENTVFGYFVLVNCYGPDRLNNWIAFPDQQALIGFLKYVFLPTAYTEWYEKRDSDGFIAIEAPPEAWLDLFENAIKGIAQDDLDKMKKELAQIEQMWGKEKSELTSELSQFSRSFKENWVHGNELFFYFHLFESPEEVGEFLIDSYEDENLGERTKDQLNLSKEELRAVTSGVYTNEFMKRKFVDLLNNRIGDMV